MNHSGKICHALAVYLAACVLWFVGPGNQLQAQGAVEPNKSPAISAVEFKIQALETRRDRYDNEAMDLFRNVEASLTKKLVEINKELNAFETAPEAMLPNLKLLEHQRVQLSIDLAGLEARKKILSVQGSTNSAESLTEQKLLNDLLKLEMAAYATVKKQVDSGTAPTTKLHDAERRVLLAKLRVAETSGDRAQSNSTRQEITAISIDMAEKLARLRWVKEELKSLGPGSRKLEEKELVKTWLINARQNLTQYDIERIEMDRELKQYKQQLERLQIDELSDDN